MASIVENLADIQDKIKAARARSGHETGQVRIVAVTKTQSVERIQEAASAGLKIFAESRIQEAQSKMGLLSGLGEWHFIGHLQTNKAKNALEMFQCIQSVDSLHLAEALSACCARQEKTCRIFAEVNVSGEAQKHGLAYEKACENILKMAAMPGMKVEGLMCMAPLSDDLQAVRPVFASLARLGLALGKDLGPLELSMGMSHDYEVAIEEGATLVRIGSALFK
jgi:pyridoxal phosphate enzyme (YggS family)